MSSSYQISYINKATNIHHTVAVLDDCDFNQAKQYAINYYNQWLNKRLDSNVLISQMFINKISKYDHFLTNYTPETSIFTYPY